MMTRVIEPANGADSGTLKVPASGFRATLVNAVVSSRRPNLRQNGPLLKASSHVIGLSGQQCSSKGNELSYLKSAFPPAEASAKK
jgi:hypothetical protein